MYGHVVVNHFWQGVCICVDSWRTDIVVRQPSRSASVASVHWPLSADIWWNAFCQCCWLWHRCQCRILDRCHVKEYQQVWPALLIKSLILIDWHRHLYSTLALHVETIFWYWFWFLAFVVLVCVFSVIGVSLADIVNFLSFACAYCDVVCWVKLFVNQFSRPEMLLV